MSDLQMLRDLGTSLDTDPAAPVADIRNRVMAGAGAVAAGPVAAEARPVAGRRGPRFGWRIALAGGLAAAVVGGAVMLDAGDADRVAPPNDVTLEAAPAKSEHLLLLAARVAATSPELTPRPDQFILIESTLSQMSTAGPVGSAAPAPPGPGPATPEWGPARTARQQEWRSADGTRDGLLRDGTGAAVRTPGCVDGRETFSDVPGQAPAPCETLPGYLKDLPTDADAMLTHLRRTAAEQGVEVYSVAGLLLFQGYLPPPARAALFQALATLPGSTVVDDLTDAAGRHGTAVTRTSGGVRWALIFDPASHAFMGSRTDIVGANNGMGLPVGATPWNQAITRVDVVDQAGQLPN